MKKLLSLLLCAALLCGCSNTLPDAPDHASETSPSTAITEILLSDHEITVNGGAETKAVYTSQDIIYYQDMDTYKSGNPYGVGTEAD